MQSRLDAASIQELGKRLKSVRSSTMTITHPDRVLLVGCDRLSVPAIKRSLINLRVQAWLINGAERLTVYCSDGELIFDGATWPIGVWNTLISNDIASEDCCMATATKERLITDNSTMTPSSISNGLVRLATLETIAQNTGNDPKEIAFAIAAKGHMVGFNEQSNEYIASIDGIQDWTDLFLQEDLERYKQQRRQQLISGVTAGVAVAEPKVKPSRRRTTKPTEAKPSTARRKTFQFKAFTKANSREGTLGKFLHAQGWDEVKRIEVIEAIAALPPEPAEELTQAEAALQRVLKVYKVSTPKARQQFIDTARGMTGTSTQSPA